MTLLITIIALALFFDYINGFHDAANSIVTIVSTKVLTPFRAVLWAASFNLLAFFIAKYIIGEFGIANTVSKTVLPEFVTLPVIFSGLIAAIMWNLATWWLGIPSSSSHTLIGGFAGAAIMSAGTFGAVHGGKMVSETSAGFLWDVRHRIRAQRLPESNGYHRCSPDCRSYTGFALGHRTV